MNLFFTRANKSSLMKTDLVGFSSRYITSKISSKTGLTVFALGSSGELSF